MATTATDEILQPEHLGQLALGDRDDFAAYALADAAPRPDRGGKQGKQMSVLSNLYGITVPVSMKITHFDVEIKPVTDAQQVGPP